MKIGLIGKEHRLTSLLADTFLFETIEDPSFHNLRQYNLVLFNSEEFDDIPFFDVPKKTILLNLFTVGKTDVTLFTKKQNRSKELNFIVLFENMRIHFLSKALLELSSGSLFHPVNTEQNLFYDFSIINHFYEKSDWFKEFQKNLNKNVHFGSREFTQTISTVVDELITNAYMHGYQLDLKTINNQQKGKVIIRWGVDHHHLVIKVTDFSGAFHVTDFLAKQKTKRSASELTSAPTGGLGIPTTLNFVDHVEYYSSPGVRTEARLYLDMNRNFFRRKRHQEMGSLILFNHHIDRIESMA